MTFEEAVAEFQDGVVDLEIEDDDQACSDLARSIMMMLPAGERREFLGAVGF